MKTLDELKALQLPRLDWRTILTYTPSIGETEEVTRVEAELDEYFQQFLPGSETCVGCGKALVGFLGSFQWGLQNGEGQCATCGYPARGYHRNIGPIEFLPLVLQYHPDILISAEQEK